MSVTKLVFAAAMLLSGAAWGQITIDKVKPLNGTSPCPLGTILCNGPYPNFIDAGTGVTTSYTTNAIPIPPTCTVTMELPSGVTTIPDRVDARIDHVGSGAFSANAERCKIEVKVK